MPVLLPKNIFKEASMFRLRISKADKLFSRLIRTLADWTCERCFTRYEPPTTSLHCSHFHGRGKKSVRFDRDNAAALCHGCHRFFTSFPEYHRQFFIHRLGEERFNKLLLRANYPAKVDEKMIAMALEIELKELQEKRMSSKVGNCGG